MENSQILLETKLVSDISGTFYVPSYQRGYRWGEDEVLRLLNDIYVNGKKNYWTRIHWGSGLYMVTGILFAKTMPLFFVIMKQTKKLNGLSLTKTRTGSIL